MCNFLGRELFSHLKIVHDFFFGEQISCARRQTHDLDIRKHLVVCLFVCLFVFSMAILA